MLRKGDLMGKKRFDYPCHVRLSTELHEAIQKFAQKNARTYSDSIRYLLKMGLKKEQGVKHDKTHSR